MMGRADPAGCWEGRADSLKRLPRSGATGSGARAVALTVARHAPRRRAGRQVAASVRLARAAGRTRVQRARPPRETPAVVGTPSVSGSAVLARQLGGGQRRRGFTAGAPAGGHEGRPLRTDPPDAP